VEILGLTMAIELRCCVWHFLLGEHFASDSTSGL